MQNTSFQPSLQPRSLLSGSKSAEKPTIGGLIEARQSEEDKLDPIPPNTWTPKYSRAYRAAASPHSVPNGTPPHLLPPPPSGAAAQRDPKVVAGATPSTRGTCSPSASDFSPRTPVPVANGKSSRSSPGSRHSWPQRQEDKFKSLNSRSKPRPRIDPDHVPRPEQQEHVKQEGGRVYETTKYSVPPLSTEVCTIVDKGSASCEFMVCSLNQVPANAVVGHSAHVPLAVLVKPFSELTALEAPVPLVEIEDEGPLRCTECKAYVNPYFSWEAGGREVVCNFCNHRMQVPGFYASGLDSRGKRLDIERRPELMRGSVEFVAPRDYTEGPLPGPPVTVLVVEVSIHSIRSGLLAQVFRTLRQLLDVVESPASRIALITYGRAVHFHAFYPYIEEARIVTVSDVEEVFLPCSHEVLCVDVVEAAYRAQFDGLFEGLLDRVKDCSDDKVAGGAALMAAVELAGRCGGGHVIMFHASLPSAGIGALVMRDDIKLYTENGDMGGLLKPQQANFLEDITSECFTRSVAVSAICAPAPGAFVDIATLSTLPRRTGGEMCYLPGFDARRDGEHLHYVISRAVAQEAAYGCALRFRCSKGLSVSEVYAQWDPDLVDQSLCHVPRLSTDASTLFALSHVDRVEGRKNVYLQAACLYTSRSGRRLIRVHTLRLPVSNMLNNVFRYSDIEMVTCVLLRQAAAAALSGFPDIQDRLSEAAANMLWSYRVNCASLPNRNSPQLILAEALKLLPLYVGSIRKLAVFRSSSGVRVDDKVAGLVRLLGMPIAQIMPVLYPRVYQLAPPANPNSGMPTKVKDNVYLPPFVRCSVEKLNADCVYLVDNGLELQIYVRAEVPSDVLEDTFGTRSVAKVPQAVCAWAATEPADLTEDGRRALAICQQIRRERSRLPWLPLTSVLPGTPEEARLLAMLVEDAVSREACYVDFLVSMHDRVRKRISS